jgi:hypothetical protein
MILNEEVGLVVPGLVIIPNVRLKVCEGIEAALLFNEVMVIFSWIKSTLTNGIGFMLVPETLIEVIEEGRLIDAGRDIYNHPLEERLSCKIIVNTYRHGVFTNKV